MKKYNKYESENFTLEVDIITGKDSKTFNTTINAFRSMSLVNFLNKYEEELTYFFAGVRLITLEEEKEKDKEKAKQKVIHLQQGYQQLNINNLKKYFDIIVEIRRKELDFLFNPDDKPLKEISDAEKIYYTFLYKHGHRIGGYPALASLHIQEILQLTKYFDELQIEEIKELQKKQTTKQATKQAGL